MGMVEVAERLTIDETVDFDPEKLVDCAPQQHKAAFADELLPEVTCIIGVNYNATLPFPVIVLHKRGTGHSLNRSFTTS